MGRLHASKPGCQDIKKTWNQETAKPIIQPAKNPPDNQTKTQIINTHHKHHNFIHHPIFACAYAFNVLCCCASSNPDVLASRRLKASGDISRVSFIYFGIGINAAHAYTKRINDIVQSVWHCGDAFAKSCMTLIPFAALYGNQASVRQEGLCIDMAKSFQKYVALMRPGSSN